MKKFTTLLAAMLLCFCFTACNDDATENDAAYTQQLIGHWRLTYATSDSSTEISYRFESGKFTYSTYTTTQNGMKATEVYVTGTWNVQKCTLQLYYDLSTLRCEGMSQAQAKEVEESMYKDNLLLQDMNKDGKPYGAYITFVDNNGKQGLKLSTINGTFVKI